MADDSGVGRFVKTPALLAIHPGKSYAKANFLEGDIAGLMVDCRLFRVEVSITFIDVH